MSGEGKKTAAAGHSERAAARVSSILDAAEACFTESGFAGTSTRQIAARAGVTQPLLHHYFGSKEALFERVFARAFEEYDEEQAAQWQLEPGHLDFFVTGLTVLFRWLGRRRSLSRLIMWARLEGRIDLLPPASGLREKVARRFHASQRQGLMRQDVGVNESMMLVEALMKGFWDQYDELRNTLDLRNERSADFEQGMEETIVVALIRALMVPEVHAEAIARYRGNRG